MTSGTAHDVFARLLTINTEAMAGGLYEVAFHALTAALHAAEACAAAEWLDAVARRARQQLELIDEHRPDHRPSSRSAAERGHSSVFEMLERQARTKAVIARKPLP